MNKKNIIIIPARLNSSRLPQKLLRLVQEQKTLIQLTYEQCSKSGFPVFIATDSKKIIEECLKFCDREFLIKTGHHNNGTSRIVEAINHLSEYKNILNVQGDEPLVTVEMINEAFKELEAGNDLISFYYETTAKTSNDEVKVVLNHKKFALYFSRENIPFNQDENRKLNRNVHVGIYGYKKDLLLNLPNLNLPDIARNENLEQLKFLYYDYKIKMIKTDDRLIGVDNEQELIKLIKYLNKNGKR